MQSQHTRIHVRNILNYPPDTAFSHRTSGHQQAPKTPIIKTSIKQTYIKHEREKRSLKTRRYHAWGQGGPRNHARTSAFVSPCGKRRLWLDPRGECGLAPVYNRDRVPPPQLGHNQRESEEGPSCRPRRHSTSTPSSLTYLTM